MTKHYAARKLLELGPLTMPEFVSITGWKYDTCKKVLYRLRLDGFIRNLRRGSKDAPSLYELA